MHLIARLVHVAVVSIAICYSATPAMARNILLLVADDYGTDACSLYTSGPLVAPTPNLDALAQAGVSGLYRINGAINTVFAIVAITLCLAGVLGLIVGRIRPPQASRSNHPARSRWPTQDGMTHLP